MVCTCVYVCMYAFVSVFQMSVSVGESEHYPNNGVCPAVKREAQGSSYDTIHRRQEIRVLNPGQVFGYDIEKHNTAAFETTVIIMH